MTCRLVLLLVVLCYANGESLLDKLIRHLEEDELQNAADHIHKGSISDISNAQNEIQKRTETHHRLGDYLSVGAFNIRNLGKTKASKKEVMNIIHKIIPRYDLILIQELVDITGDVIKDIMDDLDQQGVRYELSLSERLGRSNSKEEYAYLYHPDKITILESKTYPDPQDEFEREPYCILLKTDVGEFGVIGIHTKPDHAKEEINALVKVYDYFSELWNIDDFILMGDFNGDCSYVSASDWDDIMLFKDNRFTWLIDNSFDTTVKSTTHCAYDRLVIAGNLLKSQIPQSGVQSYRFDIDYQLSYEETLEVSDHYPVECKIYIQVEQNTLNELRGNDYVQTTSVKSDHGSAFCSLTSTQAIFQSCASELGYAYNLIEFSEGVSMKLNIEHITESKPDDIFRALKCLSDNAYGCSGLVESVSADLLRINMDNGAFPQPMKVPGISVEIGDFILELAYNFESNGKMPYEIIVSRKISYH